MILFVVIGIQFIIASQHSVAWTNGLSFADDDFKCIFLNKDVWILLKCVPDGPISNKSALVPVTALNCFDLEFWQWVFMSLTGQIYFLLEN